ncbi:MAG TPA: type I restriction endonuclease [Solirubrobacteraceae bacterium]|jgi:type I restriction enzyme R subunit
MSSVTEKLLEDEITAHLLAHSGYRTCKTGTNPKWREDFDANLGLDTKELFTFIEETQQSQWEKLVKAHGGDKSLARQRFVQRLARQIDEHGTVDVIRHGIRDQNVEIRLSYRQPAFGVAPELVAHYDANRLTVTRQLPFDPDSNKTLDLCLFLNGIPMATAELKNHLTGQTIEQAIKQYREDRDAKNVTLARRAIVHFAVDPDSVAMTTRLDGESTRFLPFNLGHDLGKGNPPNPDGHKTSYLWEHVWSKDAWLDILHRFIHVDRPEKGSLVARRAAEKVIFPRYHQWDAVKKLEADAAANGAGHSYLIQHSAGSGKSNTIAWTAHRLSTLHTAEDRKVFDKVIVITDRVILDRQLQDTIYQFEHARGVVVKIDEDSDQLAEALRGEQARIIITTLWKFPFVIKKIGDLPTRNYAIVIDEAHSSQTGETANDLRIALGANEEQELTAAEAEDAGLLSAAIDPVEEALAKSAGARGGRQPNLSYFAFTATPKGRTLEKFGRLNPQSKVHEPFHLYSMRQAIEEGFIMDVLVNYTTYQTFWKIEKATLEDPKYDAKKARQAIARFVSLHPHHLAQKAEIIVEHFSQHTAKEMGGLAKAMVVTSSRLHAVRYKQSIDKYIKAKGYEEINALVAFSGKIDDGSGRPLTEANMNGFPEARTAEEFGEPDYGVLIVAEKFQTGFDQPLLHTMYVDKPLIGLAAVQTLSRLNRTHPLKENTFVLDFRNDTEDIIAAFEQFHGCTVAPPTDPNILWDARRRLDKFDLLRPEEIEAAMPALLGAGASDEKRSAETYAALGPAKARFEEMDDEQRLEVRDALNRFVRTYSFVSQIAAFPDAALERDYVYCRALSLYLRDAGTVERLDLGTEVELTHLRHQITFNGTLSLASQVGEVHTFLGEGTGGQQELEVDHLSSIVAVLNDRFGMNLSDVDELLFDQLEESWIADGELSDQARNNTIENFRLVFDRKFLQTVITRAGDNEEIYKKILDDEDFRIALGEFYLRKVYARLREDL